MNNLKTFDDIFSSIFGNGAYSNIFPSVHRNVLTKSDISPASTVISDGKVLHLIVELPGIDKDTLSATVENDIMTVSADKSYTLPEGFKLLRDERIYGKFYREYRIPKGWNVDSLKAEYSDGVLKISMERLENLKPRQLAIESKK